MKIYELCYDLQELIASYLSPKELYNYILINKHMYLIWKSIFNFSYKTLHIKKLSDDDLEKYDFFKNISIMKFSHYFDYHDLIITGFFYNFKNKFYFDGPLTLKGIPHLTNKYPKYIRLEYNYVKNEQIGEYFFGSWTHNNNKL